MKYIFWDFNGTILDDAKLCYDILTEMLAEEQRPPVTFESYLKIFEFPIQAYYAKVYDLEKTPFEILAYRFIKRYQPRSLELKLHQDAVEVISYFKEKGIINVLLSASEINNLKAQLNHFGITHLFETILGTSDVYAASKVDVAKQFIEAQNINPHEVIMIGDTLHDAQVAHALGCDIILFTKGHQHPSRLKDYRTISAFKMLIDQI